MNEYLDVIWRSSAVYLFMILAIQLTAKKELSQLNTLDVVLILLISNAVQNAMVGSNTSLLGGICAASVLFLLNLFLKKVVLKNKGLKNLLNSKPIVLIHDGRIDFKALVNLDISQDELEEAMREHGIDQVKDVRLSMFEMDGSISIVSKDQTDEKLRETKYKRKRMLRHHNLI